MTKTLTAILILALCGCGPSKKPTTSKTVCVGVDCPTGKAGKN